MERLIINGGKPLYGHIEINGMKNSALPIICATILIGDKCVIDNIPPVSDILKLFEILSRMGAVIEKIDKNKFSIDTKDIVMGSAPYDLVSGIRGSYYIMGAELGRFRQTHVGYPGGCNFGIRPIDFHIKGFEALGAKVSTVRGYIDATTDGDPLMGNNIYLNTPSVGATINIMLAAVMAEGVTVIDNAAREPHIVDLANFLISAGADITGAGTSVIKIKGVESLHSCEHKILPDMIEAGTYMVVAAATKGKITVSPIVPKHLEAVTQKLREIGAVVEECDDSLTVSADHRLTGCDIDALPYPGFPTDMQPQFTVLLAMSDGPSCIRERVWENRFKYTDELFKTGMKIKVNDRTAFITGVDTVFPAPMTATDLRAGAAMVIAALCAEGQSEIYGTNKIERGYYDLISKLRGVGADITKEDE